jgi:hypothetical protein
MWCAVVGWAADVGADAAMNRAVDHGPRVHGRPAEGGNPRSNPGLRSWIERLGTPTRDQVAADASGRLDADTTAHVVRTRRDGGGHAGGGGARRRLAGARLLSSSLLTQNVHSAPITQQAEKLSFARAERK